jgi:hypothetical protein
MTRSASLLTLVTLTACSAKTATSAESAHRVSPATLPAIDPPALAASPPPRVAPPSAVPPAAVSAPAPPPSVEASAAPAPAASASASPTAASAPTENASLPRVVVANIGMHIGGGPNDDRTKDPIRRSVQPHFDELRRCFALVEDAHKAGDFGVDLRIDRAGGKALVSHPRSALKGKEFKRCVVSTFETIDFLKPRGGTTTVSYSLRFTPAPDVSDDGGSAPKPPR